MSWYSIREFTQKNNLSSSTVRRHIAQGKISAKKFGRNWYIEYPDRADTGGDVSLHVPVVTEARSEPAVGVQGIVEFSSKALNHYLMMHEQLMAEKELRLQEKDAQIQEAKQEAADLEGYVKILEQEIERLKERPEGWR
jgi:hypothetical protein